MDPDEFNLELEKLYESERKKEPFYLESLETERQSLVSDFYDHYATLSEWHSADTVEAFLNSITGFKDGDTDEVEDLQEQNEGLIDRLSELMQESVEENKAIRSGEIQVSGRGIVLFYADHQGEQDDEAFSMIEVAELEDGLIARGEVDEYAVVVAPMMAYEKYIRWLSAGDLGAQWEEFDISSEPPGLLLKLNNVTLFDGSGEEVETMEAMLVPLAYSSMRFDKVVRLSSGAELAQNREEVKAPIVTYFQGEFITGVFNDKENDLNYNDYSGEEFAAAHDAHLDEIRIYMSAVDSDETVILTTADAFDVLGNQRDIVAMEAKYIDSVFMKPKREWRVVHAFSVEIDDEELFIHVLSEDIVAINRLDEK